MRKILIPLLILSGSVTGLASDDHYWPADCVPGEYTDSCLERWERAHCADRAHDDQQCPEIYRDNDKKQTKGK